MHVRLLQLALVMLTSLLCAQGYCPNARTAFAAVACSTRQVTFAGAGDAAVESSITAIACATSRIRSLQPKSPVTVRFLAAAALRTAISQTAQTELASESVAGGAAALHLLGALTTQQDLAALDRGQYSIASSADYDMRTRSLYVRASKTPLTPLERAVIAHEYTKALQDQFFGLSGLLSNAESAGGYNTDSLLAREAVVEGDAFTTMLSYAASFSRPDQVTFNQQMQNSGTTISDFAHDRISFPTQQGTVFVRYLMTTAEKGKSGQAATAAAVAAVNHALTSPPSSTRQVLNPSLYLKHVQVGALLSVPTISLGAQWKRTSSDVLGAFAVADLLGQHQASGANAQTANLAAATLQSDRWSMYQRASDSVLVWRARFDSTAGTHAFEKAFLSYTGARFHATLAAAAPVDWHAAGYAMSLRVHGANVALAIGSSPDLQVECEQAISQLGLS